MPTGSPAWHFWVGFAVGVATTIGGLLVLLIVSVFWGP
jgi:hypothetical protein